MDPMRTFLTDENISCHKEYMKTLRLRHSIMEKSCPEIKGKSISEIEKMCINNKEKQEILQNFREYLAHHLYFSSFCHEQRPHKFLKKYYSSTEAFLYQIYLSAMSEKTGFIFVYISDRGIPEIMHRQFQEKLKYTPRLSLDISEHAYFLDYRFDKESYIRNAISHLNLSLLDNCGR